MVPGADAGVPASSSNGGAPAPALPALARIRHDLHWPDQQRRHSRLKSEPSHGRQSSSEGSQTEARTPVRLSLLGAATPLCISTSQLTRILDPLSLDRNVLHRARRRQSQAPRALSRRPEQGHRVSRTTTPDPRSSLLQLAASAP